MTDEQKMKKSEIFVRIIAGIFAFLFIIGIFVLKSFFPTFSVLKMVFSILGIIIFFGSFVIIWHLINVNRNLKDVKEEKIKKQPEAITIELARELALNAVQNTTYADYIVSVLWDGSEELGKGTKSNVYTLCGLGYYVKEKYYIILNMHFPEKKRCILIDPTDSQLRRAQQLCATYPEAEPNYREITNENQLLGTRQTIREKLPDEDKKEEENKKKKEEEKSDI